MYCWIPTPTTESNTSTGMIWVTLNMPSDANRQGISHCLESGQWWPCWMIDYVYCIGASWRWITIAHGMFITFCFILCFRALLHMVLCSSYFTETFNVVEPWMQCLLCFVLVAYYLCAFYIELECVCLCVHPTYDERLHVISCCKLLKITPVYQDFFDHPLLRLLSRKPIWSDLSPADTSFIPVEIWMAVCLCGQEESHLWTYYPASRFQSRSFSVVYVKPLP